MSYYNTKIIDYGDFYHVQHYQKGYKRVDFPEDVQNVLDEEEKETIKNDGLHKQRTKKEIEHCLSVSVNRSKNNLYRIARSNKWDLFITLTFDRNGKFTDAVDSSDYNLCSKLVTKFMKKLKKYNPDMIYLIVPELHSDKIHYHYHGLLGNVKDIDISYSGHDDFLGSKIYNINGWCYGFSTATYVKHQAKVRNYIGKYITKDLMNNLKFKKRYYCSQNVKIAPEEFLNYTLDDIYDLFGDNICYVKSTHIDKINRITYMEIRKDVDN